MDSTEGKEINSELKLRRPPCAAAPLGARRRSAVVKTPLRPQRGFLVLLIADNGALPAKPSL